MDYREARARGERELREMERNHRQLADWCDKVGGTTELTEDTVNGQVRDGLTCRVHGNSLVSAYDGSDGAKKVTQYDSGADMETVHSDVDQISRITGRRLSLVRDGEVDTVIDMM